MTTINATIRSFVAIELPDEVRDALSGVQSAIKERMQTSESSMRWVRPESIHLTLQFLGDVPIKVLPLVSDAIRKGCAQTSAFELELGGPGVFPNLRRPRVVWIGLKGDQRAMYALKSLQAAISDELQPQGFKPDKEFKPHLTLGRVREGARQDDYAAIARAISETPIPELTAPLRVEGVSLMRSELRPAGSVYTQTSYVELSGA
jgi:2'-5' RNA ligase